MTFLYAVLNLAWKIFNHLSHFPVVSVSLNVGVSSCVDETNKFWLGAQTLNQIE